MINLEKIKPTVASSVITCLLSFFSVEFMIYLLHKDLFMHLDYVKLVCVGLGITAPLLICNSAIHSSNSRDRKKAAGTTIVENPEEDEKQSWAVAGGVTVMLVSFINLISYTYHFSLYRALWILFWVELSILIVSALPSKKSKSIRK